MLHQVPSRRPPMAVKHITSREKSIEITITIIAKYLKKRCMIADYDHRSGGRQRSAVNNPSSSQKSIGSSLLHQQLAVNVCGRRISPTVRRARSRSGTVQDPSSVQSTFRCREALLSMGYSLPRSSGATTTQRFKCRIATRAFIRAAPPSLRC